ncbi:MAG: phosphodiester glycosidase family protein [Clostridiales Family XIII bacterium]|jgi:hypothetical protein|nr:phosphodiester glycosidase family protein [Clostridiales Family XIII bacterium]
MIETFFRAKRIRRLSLLSAIVLLALQSAGSAFAAAPYDIQKGLEIGGVKINCVRIDMNNPAVRPVQISANGNLVSTASVAEMANAAGAFAAINGTYFEAYNGVPVPWGTLIRDGKLLHISNGGAVVGFTDEGRLLIDRLRFDFLGYVNGAERSIPWRINHPSEEPDAITLFTPEYGAAVPVAPGARVVLVSGGIVTQISTGDFWTPGDGFALLYGPAVAYLADERFKIGDSVYYTSRISTTFTDANDWNSVKVAVGAGPSLIINGQITADGAAEGFTEAKINTNRSARSFIGAGEDGRVVIGTMAAATLSEAAAACREMGLINAMCLDGGGSVGLTFEGKAIAAGRNVNNILAFTADASATASSPADGAGTVNASANGQKISVNGAESVIVQAYNINGNNYFKLRDVAFILKDTARAFGVSWDEATATIGIRSGEAYLPDGSELDARNADGNRAVRPGTAQLLIDGEAKTFNACNIDGYNYFKLRDFEVLGLTVEWNEAAKVILLGTD